MNGDSQETVSVLIPRTQMKKYEKMVQDISSLGTQEHIIFLHLINKCEPNVVISENKNGCFINITDLKLDTLKQLEEMYEYICNTSKEINKIEDKFKEYSMLLNKDLNGGITISNDS